MKQHSPDERSVVSRRAVLQKSVARGAGFLGVLLGLTRVETVRQPAPQSGSLPGTTTGRIRRVVSGVNGEGRSYVISDEKVDASNLWKTSRDAPLGLGGAGEVRETSGGTGETRCFVAAILPSMNPKPTLANRIGFHRTPGIAYCFLLSGEIAYLTDLQEVKLRAGDFVVERSTLHSWRNDGNVPVRMLVTVVDSAA